MKTAFTGMILAALLPLVAMAGEKPRVMFGVLPQKNASTSEPGVVVRTVLSGSPADKACLKPGDRIVKLNDRPVNNSGDMQQMLRTMTPGQVVQVVYYRDGSAQPGTAGVELVPRPQSRAASAAAPSPDAAVGGDRRLRPLVVDPAIRQAMREQRAAVVAQLAELTTAFNPAEVTDMLQAIRHLARDANLQRRGWMLGEAGEVTLQFKDDAGILVLHGASQLLTLTVYDTAGVVTHTLPLNTPGERAAVPEDIRARLRALR